MEEILVAIAAHLAILLVDLTVQFIRGRFAEPAVLPA